MFDAASVPISRLFIRPASTVQPSSTVGITNVGSTVVTMVIIIFTLSLVVNFINDETYIPVSNTPDIEEYITDVLNQMVSAAEIGYNLVKNRFEGNQDLLIGNQDAFVCPIKDKAWHTITSCGFHFVDVSIYNTLDTIPKVVSDLWSRTIVAIDTTIQTLFPKYFIIEDAINSLRLFIQRFIPLQNPATPRPTFDSGGEANDTSKKYQNRGFLFKPFPDGVVQVREVCVTQCGIYGDYAVNLAFGRKSKDWSYRLTEEMTLRDYLFNQINENKVYICTTTVPAEIRGEWFYWGGSCICGNACSTTDWLGYDGCVAELQSFGVTCSATTPCTIDRLCSDREIMLVMKATDTSDVLYKHINDVCLDSCADLAGFGDFATLVALAATAGVLPAASLLGLFSASFGSTAGVPAALIPGNPRFISISIEPILKRKID